MATAEPLLQEEKDRHALFPLRDPEVWAFYKQLEGLDWTAQEVVMEKDPAQWTGVLTESERHFYRHVLGFFAVADELVLHNLDENFMAEIKPKEVCYVYGMQLRQEQVHSESYSIQIETLLPTQAERDAAFGSVTTMPVVRAMADWVSTWFDRRVPFGERLAAFAVVEGVLFQAHFASIQQLKERNIMAGLVSYNEFIARDEGMHCSFACFLLRNRLNQPPPTSRVHEILTSAVRLVDQFMAEALRAGPVAGVTLQTMHAYIRHVADSVGQAMGYPPIYEAENPYPEMDKLSLNQSARGNFLEMRTTQYQGITDSEMLRLGLDPTSLDAVQY